MTWLLAIVRKAVGLIVDDGWLAAASLLWLAAVGELLPALGVTGVCRGVALFLGLAAILAATALHRSRS